MRVLVITPPDPVVTWEEADAHLKLDGDESEKVYVEGLIAAATDHIDGPNGWLGRAIGEQVLEARFDDAEVYGTVRLPYPPLLSLLSVTTVARDGVETLIDSSAFDVVERELASPSDWPWAGQSLRREGIRVRYTAGYPERIPPAIRAAILFMVGDMHRNRVTTQPGQQSAVPMSTDVDKLLAPFRVFF